MNSTRQPELATRNGRLLAFVRENPAERPLHVSPVLQHIRDDGPALIDGKEVELTARNAAKWRQRREEFGVDAEPAVTHIKPARKTSPGLPAPPGNNFPLNIWLRGLLLTVLVATMTLSITAIFSWG